MPRRYLISMWLLSLLVDIEVKCSSNGTVSIGVIVGQIDEQSALINRSVEIAMKASNNTKYVKMNPIKVPCNLSDSFSVRKSFCALIEHQPIALIGTSQSETFDIIASYSQALRIPFFVPTMTRDATLDKENFIVSMCPSFAPAAIDFIKYNQWTKIFYVFDGDDALWRLQTLYEAFADYRIRGQRAPFIIDAIRIPNVKDCREILRKLDRNNNIGSKRIVVDLHTVQDYNVFMSQIIDVGMNRDGYHYLLGTVDIGGMDAELWRSFTFGGVNITGFQLVKASHRHNALSELLEGDNQPSVEVALTVDSVAILTTALVQIMQRPDKQDILGFRRGELYLFMNCSADPIRPLQKGHVILEHVLNVTRDGLSGKIAFDKFGHRRDYTLDLHHLSYMEKLRKIGTWEDGVGFRDINIQAPPIVDPNKTHNGSQIVTTIINPPFIQLARGENGQPSVGNERFEGFCIDMMKNIASKINMTYILKLVDDKNYGTKLPDGTWDGMIGELIRGDADIALASLTITHKREQAVYFTKPFMNTGISIMIKKPERDKPGVFSFMDPMSIDIWACIIAGYFVVSFILYVIGHFSPFEQQDQDDGKSSDTFSFINTLWFSLGALMQQGPDIFPRSLSGRILASAWWFFTLITISSYTANLAAFLTFEKLITPISSVDDLVKHRTIKFGIQASGATKDFFKDSKVPIYQTMYGMMEDSVSSVYVDDPDKGWKRVIQERGKYAFLLESSSNNYYNQRKPCKTMKVGRNLDQKGYGIAMPKISNISHDINIAVLEMAERGDLLKLEQKWWYSKGECGNADGGDKGKNALNLSNVSGVFHILISGLVTAMILSLLQIICSSNLRKKMCKKSCS